jgi:hypothetical protein
VSPTARGSDFEKQVFSCLEEELKAGRLFYMPECSAIYHQKRYHSADRKSSIIFDIAIEVTFARMQTPSVYCLVECKDHGRKIQADEVEAFYAKIQQVASAAAKGIIVTRSSFQPAALEYARAKHIGILRFPERKWDLMRSVTARYAASLAVGERAIREGLLEETHQTPGLECICNFGDTFTYSPYDFFGAITTDVLDEWSFIVATERPMPAAVPFISRAAIDDQCSTIHDAVGHKDGPVSLDTICEWQAKSCGLKVVRNVKADKEAVAKGILGNITFTPPSIVVFSDPAGAGRERFTLAHELGHLVLGHGEYLRAESFDTQDIETSEKDDPESDLIRRLEWQANRFASSLLLPHRQFAQKAVMKVEAMGIRDKGFGLIYRDHQPENERNYMRITSALMDEFAVSRKAVEVRLKELGFLRG